MKASFCCKLDKKDKIMFLEKIQPRFTDTDALGHINNVSILAWFEAARRPIFEIFIPTLNPKKWNLILARIEVDYLGQTYYEKEVEMKTYFEKVGNSSMTLIQEAYQDGVTVVRGKAIMVHFDYETNKSVVIPEDIRALLNRHVVSL